MSKEGKIRIGLLVLSTDPSSESEFRKMLKDETNIEFFVSRIEYESPLNRKNLQAMKTDIQNSASRILPDLSMDVIAYACTSGTAAIGEENIIQEIEKTHPNSQYTTPLTAACKGLDALRMSSIGLISPYDEEIEHSIINHLEINGYKVKKSLSFNKKTDLEISYISEESILKSLQEINTPAIEGFFISCTAFTIIDSIEKLEHEIGKPIITSNQALLWDALRLSEYKNYGTLMRL